MVLAKSVNKADEKNGATNSEVALGDGSRGVVGVTLLLGVLVPDGVHLVGSAA